MLQASDVVLAFSNSGSSDEIVALLPSFAHIVGRFAGFVAETRARI